MRASTVVAILCLAAGVALSVALPLPASKYASLSCYICDAQILSFADLSAAVPAVGARKYRSRPSSDCGNRRYSRTRPTFLLHNLPFASRDSAARNGDARTAPGQAQSSPSQARNGYAWASPRRPPSSRLLTRSRTRHYSPRPGHTRTSPWPSTSCLLTLNYIPGQPHTSPRPSTSCLLK